MKWEHRHRKSWSISCGGPRWGAVAGAHRLQLNRRSNLHKWTSEFQDKDIAVSYGPGRLEVTLENAGGCVCPAESRAHTG